MTTTAAAQTAVPAAYRHHQRLIVPGAPLEIGRTTLKWYELRRPDAPIPNALVAQTRSFLQDEAAAGRLDVEGEPGFVMLHLADSPAGANSVALLLVSTWRNANEVWESVYWKRIDGGDYGRVEKADHSATYCVWELGVVWHERQAWTRFLESARDAAALETYLEDHASGLV